MYLHLRIPGFHAAVHQASAARLRGRPVAVAVDGGDQSPLFATSIEARKQGVWPGLRAAAARRRCPGLHVVTPEPDLYRRAQGAVERLCLGYTPAVRGRAGRIDCDLSGTERLWSTRLRDGGTVDAAIEQAATIAERLRATAARDLRLTGSLGVALRLPVARLAARLARDGAFAKHPLLVVPAGAERELCDPLPLAWVDDCPRAALAALAECGVHTIGEWRGMTADQAEALIGASAQAALERLDRDGEPVLPEDAPGGDPEIAVARHCGAAGASPEHAVAVAVELARELGFRLRARQLTCGALTLSMRWTDGRVADATLRPRRALRHDDELAGAAADLLAKRLRRVWCERLTLSAGGLGAADEQLELFEPPRARRLEAVKDRLRARFGDDLVRTLTMAGASAALAG
ncbi:MAG TPA: hypothetical protein VEL07_20710 [Planctomycetota bacterium]|nr:hypothetical protein [Planctomycetota bacterium]